MNIEQSWLRGINYAQNFSDSLSKIDREELVKLARSDEKIQQLLSTLNTQTGALIKEIAPNKIKPVPDERKAAAQHYREGGSAVRSEVKKNPQIKALISKIEEEPKIKSMLEGIKKEAHEEPMKQIKGNTGAA